MSALRGQNGLAQLDFAFPSSAQDARPRSVSLTDDMTPRADRPHLHVQLPERQSSLSGPSSPQRTTSPGLPPRSQSDFTISPARSQIHGSSSRLALNNLRSYQSSGPTALPLANSGLTPSASANSISSGTGGSRYGARAVAMAMDKFESRTDNRLEARAGDLGSVGAVGHGGTDEWQTVAVRTLPLFNGEGVKGYIEDLNDLVSTHTRRIADRSPTNAILYLSQHLSELLVTGMLTLSDKLQGLPGSKLLTRLNDVWSFFFSSILPYVEAIFLPFSTDARLLRATAAQQTQSELPSTKAIEVRRLALIAFRDQIVLPQHATLEQLFANVAQPRPSLSRRTSATLDGITDAQNRSINGDTDDTSEGQARRMQMVALLTSTMTDDAMQDAMQSLNRALRGLPPSNINRESTSTFRTRSRAGMIDDDGFFAQGMQKLRSQDSGLNEARRSTSSFGSEPD